VPRVVRSIPSRWGWVTFFVSNEKEIFLDYGSLLMHYPHWRPQDVKSMSPRERQYWLKLATWIADRRKNNA
jgi:hypothetical protein